MHHEHTHGGSSHDESVMHPFSTSHSSWDCVANFLYVQKQVTPLTTQTPEATAKPEGELVDKYK